MNRALLLGTLVVAVIAAALLFFKPSHSSQSTLNLDVQELPRLGQESAPVSVVIVEDFKCPVCKLFEEQIAPDLNTRYVETGEVKVYSLIWPFLGKKFSLNPDDSVLAAQAAKCVLDVAGDDGFQAFKSILFRAQGKETQIWATRERLTELAQSVEGLDQQKFQKCLSDNATLERVNEDVRQAETAKLNGTPSVFVNGEAVEYRTLTDLKDNLFKKIEAAAR